MGLFIFSHPLLLHLDCKSKSIKNTVPKALRDLISEQTKSFSISTATPKFLGRGFGETSPLIFFARKDTRFDGALQLPQGYSSAATWSVGDVSGVNLSTVIRVIQQDATGCTVRAELPGEYILSLTSDAYPDKISNSFRIKAIYKEPEGSQPGKPGDDAGSKPRPIPGGDPGGDDDVDTDPGDDGDGGSGGGGPGRPGRPPRVPEAPDPEEPVPLPPGVSAVLVDGRDLGPGGTALVEGIRRVSLAFRFADAVERHLLSASLLSAGGRRNEAEATIGGVRLSADGLALTAAFHPRKEGRYRIAYGFERKDGVRAKGSFVVKVTGGSGSSDQGDERRGGGCSALNGAVILFLLACFCCHAVLREQGTALDSEREERTHENEKSAHKKSLCQEHRSVFFFFPFGPAERRDHLRVLRPPGGWVGLHFYVVALGIPRHAPRHRPLSLLRQGLSTEARSP